MQKDANKKRQTALNSSGKEIVKQPWVVKIVIGMMKNKNVMTSLIIMIAIKEFLEIYHIKIVKIS